MTEERRGRGRPKGATSAKKPDLRVRRRNEAARKVKKPDDLDLVRRPNELDAVEPLKAAVMAALLVGQPAQQIAQQFSLPMASVRRWEEAYDISNPIQRRDKISEMLVIFVEQEIKSLMAISIATSDDYWIQSQSANELAMFLNVKQDRLMKLLEVFGKASESIEQIKQSQVVEIDGDYE